MGTAKEKSTEKQQEKVLKQPGPKNKPTAEAGLPAAEYLPTALW